MKFYGLEIGCNKVIKASTGKEVITITTFGMKELNSSLEDMNRLSFERHPVGYGGCPKESCSVQELPKNLKAAKESYKWIATHYLISEQNIKKVKDILNKVFPPSEYVQLSNK